MIYRAGETITFVACYTADGEVKTGLTPTASVHKMGTGVVDNPTVSEDPDGNGFYYCTFTPSSDGIYTCIFKTADVTVDQKHLPGIAFRGIAGVNSLDAAITSRLASEDYEPAPTAEEIDVELSENHGAGSWQSYAIGALLLTLTDDELDVLLDGQARKPIAVFRGDSAEIEIVVTDADGAAIDLTNADAIFTAKEREDDEDAVIEKALDIYDPTHGKMKLSLATSDTAIEAKTYPADIEITFADGRVKTVWKSALEVKWDVGR